MVGSRRWRSTELLLRLSFVWLGQSIDLRDCFKHFVADACGVSIVIFVAIARELMRVAAKLQHVASQCLISARWSKGARAA